MTEGRRPRWPALIALALGLLAAELVALLVGEGLLRPRAAFLFYAPDVAAITAAIDESPPDTFDPVVGWPAPSEAGGDRYDVSFARRSPGFPLPAKPCVAAHGDSFVFSAEVDDAHAWPEVLASRLGCRVANYGVGGYGTDQALLRLRQLPDDGARVVVLGIYPDNALRNVNRYRFFLAGPGAESGMKPRFVLDDAALRLLPRPPVTSAHVGSVLKTPSALEAETFLPGSRWGPVRWEAPYVWRVVQLATHPRLVARLSGGTSWGAFVQPGHESGALELTLALASAFVDDVKGRGAQPVVVVFATASQHDEFVATSTWATAALLAGLRQRDAPVVHLGEVFAGHLGDRSFCELLRSPATCSGHYNEEGYGLVASAVFDVVEALVSVERVPSDVAPASADPD